MGKKKYKYLIFDADHTLLDYIADEGAAFLRLYTELEIPIEEELLRLSRHFSETVWTEAGLYNVHDAEIQKAYHTLYRSHVTGIFEEIFKRYPSPCGAQVAGEKFLRYLEQGGNLMPGAEDTLKYLSQEAGGGYGIAIATNGLCDIQKGRLSALKEYAQKIYISEALGVIKPLKCFFNLLLQDLGATPSECLMIGDSLSSDVVGAHNAGIDACWYNPFQRKNETGIKPEYEICSLEELKSFL